MASPKNLRDLNLSELLKLVDTGVIKLDGPDGIITIAHKLYKHSLGDVSKLVSDSLSVSKSHGMLENSDLRLALNCPVVPLNISQFSRIPLLYGKPRNANVVLDSKEIVKDIKYTIYDWPVHFHVRIDDNLSTMVISDQMIAIVPMSALYNRKQNMILFSSVSESLSECKFLVYTPNSTEKNFYIVYKYPEPNVYSCNCPAWTKRVSTGGVRGCKHIELVCGSKKSKQGQLI